MRTGRHILFWILVTTLLTITFGQADGDYIKSLLFVTFLLPAAMGSSYFFNYFLVPRYLLRKKYFKFGLYLTYTLVFSLYLELVALLLALILLANYNYENLNPYTTNLIWLTVTLYLIVFVNAFVILIRRYQNKEHLVAELEEKEAKDQMTQLVVRSDRKLRPLLLSDIVYIESLADYVQIHLKEDKVITKEKISELADKLPTWFLRIHRSFVINSQHLTSYSKEEVQMGTQSLPISRSYKKSALEFLNQE